MAHRDKDSEPATALLVLVFLLPIALFLIFLLLASVSGVDELRRELGRAIGWYDKYFFFYNVCLALFAVAIVPLITYFYVRTMKGEKIWRLQRALGEQWEDCAGVIMPLIRQQFRFRNYLGSLLAVMVIIATGVFPILLLKAYFPEAAALAAASGSRAEQGSAPDFGLNYGLGANLLLVGPLVEIAGNHAELPKYYRQIAVSLTAFEFGFLGAYIYFISQLLRSYFTLDLSPHTYVAGAIRMTTSSVLALVLSFVLPGILALAAMPGAGNGLMALPVIAFFLGYFPNRALLWLQIMGDKVLGLGRGEDPFAGTSLARLTGMSPSSEARLEREGFDNLEALSHADSIQLAVRTGLSYQQLKYWISEARLRAQLGKDYDEFVRRTWIHTEDQLRGFYAKAGDEKTAIERLARAFVDSSLESKLTVEYFLLEEDIQKSRRAVPVPNSS